MGKLTDATRSAGPSATPEAADIETWNALPRDAQMAAFREALASPDCARPSDATMQDILKEARASMQRDGG